MTQAELLQILNKVMGESKDVPQIRRNKLGGGPPPGFGIHPKEAFLWSRPTFRVHPLTGRLEAIGGIFHRLWPDHVETLIKMHEDGWPHNDIVEVCAELWDRQLEEYKKNEDLVGSAKDHQHQNLQDDLAFVHGRNGGNGNGNGNQQPLNGNGKPPEEPEEEDFSMKSIGPFRTVVRSAKSVVFKTFVRKADTTGGERTLTPQERQVQDEHMYTRRPVGVANAGWGPVVGREADEEPSDDPVQEDEEA
jgi:hypothetical protein